MSEEEIIKGLEWSQQQMRLGNLPNYNQKHYADVQCALNLISKLQKEIDKIRQVEMEVIKENTLFSEEIDKQSRLIDKLQKENRELRKELQHYKDNIIEDLENRDRWE